MGITEATETSSKLSREVFQDVFQKIEPGVQIDFIKEEPGSGRGDNYTATLYRIQLKGSRKCITDGKKQKWEKTVICKRLPENAIRREAYKSDKLFRNEVEFYTTIMPELIKFQSTKTDKVFNAIPKCYFAHSDLLIMEDLRMRGFKMPDRKKGLTFDETKTVLRQVAQFHGLSLAYKFENIQKFEALKNLVHEGLFCASNQSWYKNYYERLTRNAIKMVSDVLPEDSKYLVKMKSFAESTSFFSRMVDLVSAESTLSAICHGDCWVNNFLYRYELDGDCVNVIEVCLVDFQLIRYSSIALDVANLLFCCTSKSMRDEHLNFFIRLYTDEVFQWLQTLCTRIPDHCDTEEKFNNLFYKELKAYGRFALGLALDIIPISTCSSEDAPDLYLTSRADVEEEGAPELNFPPNDLCRQKIFYKELKAYGRFALGLALDIIPISTCSSEDAPDLYLTSRADVEEEGAPELNFPPNDLCRQKMSEILIDLVDRGML